MKLGIAGDIAFSGLISTDSRRNDERFAWLAEELGICDGLIANLEAPVVADERNSGKRAFLFADPDVMSSLLAKLKVVCVSLANNHILDCGREGLANTLGLLDKNGIFHSGAGLTEEQAGPVIFPFAGKMIGFVAWNHDSTNPARDVYPDVFLNCFDLPRAVRQINELRRSSDIVVASIHWGTDYSFFHERWQKDAAATLAEAGADIIMGHHSHTLQPFEFHGSKLIFYGLGSLSFGDYRKNGRMYALYRRTKHSAVFMVDEYRTITDIISTRELKGNRIVSGGRDISSRNNRLLVLSRIRDRSRVAAAVIRFHEKVLSRIYEYFFGYYMNPVRRLFQAGNIRKVVKLFR